MKTLAQQIKQLNLDYTNPYITETNFPKQEISTEFAVVHFNRPLTSEEAVKKLEAKGLRPANLWELVAYGQQGNDTNRTVALGQSWVNPDGDRYVGVLRNWDDGRRLILLHWAGEWHGRYRFLGVKVSPKSTIAESNGFDEEFITRFWQNVDKTDECWNWTGAKHEQGYGLIKKDNISELGALEEQIKEVNFDYVNSNIKKHFTLEPIRSTDFVLYHPDKPITNQEVEQYAADNQLVTANLAELLVYAQDGWDNQDFVVALGSSAVIYGDRDVPYLSRSDVERCLSLYWYGNGFGRDYRFLLIRKNPKSTTVENSSFDEEFITRFWQNVEKTDDCWNWTGAKHEQGYGLIKKNNTSLRAHRVSVLLSGQEIPEGYQIDHLCKNTSCVNPEHLEIVTSKENTLRGNNITAINSRKTHCLKGHEFTQENTKIRKNDDGTASRICLSCAKEYNLVRKGNLEPRELGTAAPVTLEARVKQLEETMSKLTKLINV